MHVYMPIACFFFPKLDAENTEHFNSSSNNEAEDHSNLHFTQVLSYNVCKYFHILFELEL